jgi:hypothetical protein
MYLRGPGGVLVFSRFIFYFLIEKLLVRVPQHQRLSGVYVIQVARVAQRDSQT